MFQARNIQTGELAAVKIIKLEPGKNDYLIISAFHITVGGIAAFWMAVMAGFLLGMETQEKSGKLLDNFQVLNSCMKSIKKIENILRGGNTIYCKL